MKVSDSKLSRICGKYCSNYRLLIDMLGAAETSICIAKDGNDYSKSEMDECHIILDVVHSASLETVVVLGVRMNGSVILRREQRFVELNLEFMSAEKEKWITHINKFFFEAMSSVFTAGAFKLSRQKIQDGVFEEIDIDTL